MITAFWILLLAQSWPRDPSPRQGEWRAWLDSPGGELPITLVLSQEPSGWRASIKNGTERLDYARINCAAGRLTAARDPYDSYFDAVLNENGQL